MEEKKTEAQVSQVATIARPHLEAFDAERMKAQGKTPGWREAREGDPEGAILMQDKMGLSLRRHMVINPNGTIGYDGILVVELGGANIVVVDHEGRIGLQKQWRFQAATDFETFQKTYPNFDIKKLGAESWEIPRGYGVPGIPTDEQATIEVEEETGLKVVKQIKLHSWLNDNSAHKPHMTRVYLARVSREWSGRVPEDTEVFLSKLTFFTLAQIGKMAQNREIYCGISLSSIFLVHLTYPTLLKLA